VERRNSGLFLLVVYLLLAIYLLPIFPNVSGSANDLTRWATTVSLVENTSFEISWTKDLIGGEFSDVTKTKDGKIYSNKPFGISLLSAPFYAITKVIIGKPTKENIRTSWLVMRFLIGTLPLLFLGIWLYGNEVEAFSLGVLLFATPLFPYSLLYYSHVLVAVLIYMAFRLIYDSQKTLPERSFKAGLLCGFALLCEFSAIVPLIIFGLCITFTDPRDRIRRFVFYLAGVSPFIFIFAIYNQLVFGSPFAFLSHYRLAYPTLSSLYEFSISPSHGLFFFSPILLFSIFTFFASEHGGSTRHFVKIAAIVFTFAAIIGFAEKYGGGSVGARHLIIIIPLMLDSFFDGEIEDYWSYLRGFLFIISFLFCTIPMLTYAFAPPELQFPHNSFWLPLLYENNFFTTTIANTFGIINNIWTILPAMILLALAIYFVWRDAKFPFKFAVGLLIGILLVGSYMFLFDLKEKAAKPVREKIVQQLKK
jgi:hypothetical protein